MKGFFSALGSFFKRLFSRKTATMIEEYLTAAMPLVELIATMTPTRTDDEIIFMLRSFNLEDLFRDDYSAEVIMREAAVIILSKTFPGASKSHLNLAVELAVVAMKEAAKSE